MGSYLAQENQQKHMQTPQWKAWFDFRTQKQRLWVRRAHARHYNMLHSIEKQNKGPSNPPQKTKSAGVNITFGHVVD